MALHLSTALQHFLAGTGSVREAFQDGIMKIYSGAQPTNADAAVTGTLLCTITNASGAFTPEVRATGSVTLNTGASGSVTSITVNGAEILGATVPYNTSLNQTATDVADQINRYRVLVEYSAVAVGAVITITAAQGTGAAPNTFVVVSTTVTITKTDVNMSGGVSPVNGLKFAAPVVGLIDKLSTQTWSGVNAATGTAGWYRFCGTVSDPGTLDTAGIYIREDGAIAPTGVEMSMPVVALTVSIPTVVSSWQRTVPGA